MHSKTNAVYITGTDTDAGKTIFCAQLLAFLKAQGIDAISQKWVQTGWGKIDDAAFHASVAGILQSEPLDMVVPMRFSYTASPHLAAKMENRAVDTEAIRLALDELTNRHELVLCEGSGGALAPLSRNLLISDLASQLGLPAIVVVANKLGCISHALMTIESLKSRNIEVLGIAFTRVSAQTDEIIAADNIETIRAISGEVVFGEIGWLKDPSKYSPDFDAIGRSFLKRWSDYIG